MRVASAPAHRPLTILIAALGGEGGAVLADWIRDAAIAGGFPIQGTSIPGVAQRTGATTYYLELYPVRTAELGGKQPVFALTPSPGNIDLMVASELVEAGRAMQNGYVGAQTTLIAATHRVYSTAEKMQIGDGRFDTGRILAAGPLLARRAVFIDLAQLALESGTVISAVMFGAIAGSGVLPFERDACEAAIRGGAVGTEASLRGFAAGCAAMAHPSPAAADSPAPEVVRVAPEFESRLASEIPASVQSMAREGVRRVLDYQDARYAGTYLDRVSRIARLDDGDFEVSRETARFLALWMSYEDIIRVADLKTRSARFERIREEAVAQPDEPVRVVEFLRPGLPELCDMLPPTLAHPLRRWSSAGSRARPLGFGLHVATSSVWGFALLRSIAACQWFRPRSSRFLQEQILIERWLESIGAALQTERALALEIALAARLLKGYGDTHQRGRASFNRVLSLAGDVSIALPARAAAARTAREAALADAEGKLAPPQPLAQPLRFIKSPARQRKVPASLHD